MDVVDPVSTTTDPVTVTPAAAVPEQRQAEPDTAVDHVRRHAARCYWDVAECRWVCRRG